MPPPRQLEASPHRGGDAKGRGGRYYEKDIYRSLSGGNKGWRHQHAGSKHGT